MQRFDLHSPPEPVQRFFLCCLCLPCLASFAQRDALLSPLHRAAHRVHCARPNLSEYSGRVGCSLQAYSLLAQIPKP